MIEAYQRGEDLHRLTAALVTQKPLERITAHERQAAKAVNFGLLFGMQAPSLQSYARNTYDIRLTMKQSATFRRRFFESYQGVAQWHRQTRQDRPWETRTLSGRRRQWKDQPRLNQLLNSPIQGSAADILKKALILLPQALQGTGAKIVACIHDEIVLEVVDEQAEESAIRLKTVMEAAGRAFLKCIPTVAEVRISTHWAQE